MVRYGCSAFAAFAISPIFYHSSWLSLLSRRYPDAVACQKCPFTYHLVVAFTLTGQRATLHAWVQTGHGSVHAHIHTACPHRCAMYTQTHILAASTHRSHIWVHTARPLTPRTLLMFGTKSD